MIYKILKTHFPIDQRKLMVDGIRYFKTKLTFISPSQSPVWEKASTLIGKYTDGTADFFSRLQPTNINKM